MIKMELRNLEPAYSGAFGKGTVLGWKQLGEVSGKYQKETAENTIDTDRRVPKYQATVAGMVRQVQLNRHGEL
jgi:hypothetical protein